MSLELVAALVPAGAGIVVALINAGGRVLAARQSRAKKEGEAASDE
jgi:hypothetical protein